MTDYIIDSPHAALVYLDFVAMFGGDSSGVEQMRAIGDVIRGLMRRVEENALLNERHEAALDITGECDVVNVLRGIGAVPAADANARTLAKVCKHAANEIEYLRWALKDAT